MSDTPLGEAVDENGCGQTQLDDDNDGVFNFRYLPTHPKEHLIPEAVLE